MMTKKLLAKGFTLLTTIIAFAASGSALVTDAKAKSFAEACTAAVDPSNPGKTLEVVNAWKAVPAQNCAANLIFLGGSIQPAAGATITLSGVVEAPLLAIFDLSLGG